jgi:hypothetical protein
MGAYTEPSLQHAVNPKKQASDRYFHIILYIFFA